MRASALTYQGSSTRVDDPDFAYLNDYVDAVGNAEDAVTQSAETLQKAQQAYEEALAERDARQGDYMEALSAVARAQADYITALSLAEQSDNGAMQGAGLGTEGAGSGAATKAASEPKHARVVNPAEGETAKALRQVTLRQMKATSPRQSRAPRNPVLRACPKRVTTR